MQHTHIDSAPTSNTLLECQIIAMLSPYCNHQSVISTRNQLTHIRRELTYMPALLQKKWVEYKQQLLHQRGCIGDRKIYNYHRQRTIGSSWNATHKAYQEQPFLFDTFNTDLMRNQHYGNAREIMRVCSRHTSIWCSHWRLEVMR